MLRFSIRDVLLVMAIVAILLAWYANRREMTITEHELRSEVQQLQRKTRISTGSFSPIASKCSTRG